MNLVNILIYGIYVFAFLFVVIVGWSKLGRRLSPTFDNLKGMRVLVVLALINILFYVGTKFGAGGAPRYILSLYTALVMFIGFLLAHLRRYSKMVSYSLLVIILISNIFGNLIVKGESTDLIQLISFLKSHNLKYAYSDYWTSYRVAFISQEQVICSPLLDEVVIDRYPEYTQRVQRAPVSQLAYVFLPDASIKRRFEKVLKSKRINYHYARIGGYDVYYLMSQKINRGFM